MPVISGAAVVRSTLPGYEIGYDQITANVNPVGTTEGTATTVITCAAHTFDGAAVLATFYSGLVQSPGVLGGSIVIGLFESGTLVSRFGAIVTPAAALTDAAMMGGFRFTPSAGSHSYVVASWVSSTTGPPQIYAGAGGAGNQSPAWVRFTKV